MNLLVKAKSYSLTVPVCTEFGSGHFRTIILPRVETLAEAYDKLEKFIIRHKA